MDPPIGLPRNPLDSGPVLLDGGTAVRFAEATRYVEGFYRGGAPQPPGLGRLNPTWAAKFSVLSAIAAATAITTPRPGSGRRCRFDTGAWVQASSAGSATIYNPSPGGSIAAGRLVTANWVGGIWEIVMDPCG